MTMAGRLCRFGCVGAAAAAVHLGVVALLVPIGIVPLVANVAGFATAFQVSYVGHRRWTFQAEGGGRTYLRMLAVSLGAFALNEAMFACLLRFTPLDYRVSLVIVLVAVAGLTFLASQLWVFTGSGGKP